jgi:hypothetical protein
VLGARPVHAQVPATGGQVWSTGNVWLQFPSKLRVLLTGELNAGTDYSYQQWSGGVGVGYRWKRVSNLAHMININADKESRLVVGAGYEYLWTDQEGSATAEDRIVVDATPRYRPQSHWLLDLRNRAEFRWVDGAYSTRLRFRATVERDIPVRKNGRLTPYASAEFFYNFGSGSWDEQQYAVGVELPYRRIFMVQAYYLFQHGSGKPENVNVLGITVNFFLRNGL